MFNVIKLFILFVIFLFICECFGLYILKKINISYNLIALPIGMALFGCLYEFMILPIQFFQLDSILLKYAFIISLAISFLFGRKNVFSIFNRLSKRDIILILVFAVTFTLTSLNPYIYGNDMCAGDSGFYISLINGHSLDGVKVNGLGINSFYPSVAVKRQYAFYGHMHLLSAISNLLEVDALITINFFQRWYQIVFYLTNILNIYIICQDLKIFKNINKYFQIIFLFSSYLISSGIQNTICVYTTTMMFVVTFLIFYLKDNNKGWLVLFAIYSYHAISVRSTYLFLIAFFLLPYYLYLLINDRFVVEENVYIISPVLFSLILYFSYKRNIFMLFGFLLLLFAIILLIPKFVNRIGKKATKNVYICILLSILCFFIFKSFFIGNVVATWNDITVVDLLINTFFNYSSFSSFIISLYHLSYLIFGGIIFITCIYRKRNISYYSMHIVVIFILCLNPLVAPYIAQFLKEVYNRLFQLWINPLFYLLIIDGLIELYSLSLIKKDMCMFFCTLFIISYSGIYISDSYDNIRNYAISIANNVEVSYYYKIGKVSYELGNVINKYAIDNNKKNVSVACPPDIINLCFVGNRTKLSKLMGDKYVSKTFLNYDYYTYYWAENEYDYPINFYLYEPYRYFDDSHIENAYDKVPDIETMIKESDTDVIIIEKWNGREETSYHLVDYFESFFNLIYENKNYLVFVVD